MCHFVPQKPIYSSRASPVRKAPFCNGFKCTSNSKQASKPFLPSGTEDEDPTTDFEIFGSGVSTWHHLVDCSRSVMVSHGKAASKLERMKHIRRTHEQFPYLMAALQMEASCIVQSFTKCRTNTSKKTREAPWFTNSARCPPPVNFFAAHSRYDLSFGKKHFWMWVIHSAQTAATFAWAYLMAALQMKASCIVQSLTKCRTNTSKKTREAPWFTNSARCLHLSTFCCPF